MPNYKPYNYDQTEMVAINYMEQLQPGTFEHALFHLVETKLDLSIFDERYKNESGGRAAYDPGLLLKVVLYAYYKGIRSSREIEWNCKTNIIFKALSCNVVPHFTTIAAFISDGPKRIENLFEQILLICDAQGLLGKELLAIDGCKLPSNASKEHSGTHAELRSKQKKLRKQIRQHMKLHREMDKKERQGSEQSKRRQKSIESLNAASERIEDFLKKHPSPRMGKGKQSKEVKSNVTDNESCKMRTSKGVIQGYNGIATVDKKHQIIVDAQAFGEGQEQQALKPVLEAVEERITRLGISNGLSEDGVIITADTGYASEANMKYVHDEGMDAYIPDNQFRKRDQRFKEQQEKHGSRYKKKEATPFLSNAFRVNCKKKTCHCPSGEAMWLKREGRDKTGATRLYFEGRLTKCRSCELKTKCMRNPSSADTRTGHGRQVSFLVKGRGNYTHWMRERIDTERGKEIYSHRMSVVEPVFANICGNKHLNRFSHRGRNKVDMQWKLFSMVHNIEKLSKYGHIG